MSHKCFCLPFDTIQIFLSIFFFPLGLKHFEISLLFVQTFSIPALSWRIRGTSFQQSGGPSSPTATCSYVLYLAHIQEVSEIQTRFHVTNTLPATHPPVFKLGILSAQPGIEGPRESPMNSVKLDSSHFASCTWQKKKCPPCGFSFCDGPFQSSWEHTTFQPQSFPL